MHVQCFFCGGLLVDNDDVEDYSRSRTKSWILGGHTNRKCIWSVVVLMFLGLAALSQEKKTVGTEKAVAGLENQWLQSQKTNNPDMVAPLQT